VPPLQEGTVRADIVHSGEMGEVRVSLNGAVENRVLERLIVFLTERAEGAGVPLPPGYICGKVAGTCTHLVYAATYKSRKASKGMGSEAGMIRIGTGHCWTYV